LAPEHIAVEMTEFELTALVALVERAQQLVGLTPGSNSEIREAIHNVADEFKSLLGHFELLDRAANE
jgi:hypothetical protein